MAEKIYVPRLKQHYNEVLRDSLTKEFGYANRMQVPRLDKVVLNMGVGEGVNDSKKVTAAAVDLGLIAGPERRVAGAQAVEKAGVGELGLGGGDRLAELRLRRGHAPPPCSRRWWRSASRTTPRTT